MFYDFFILFIKFLLRGKYHTTKIKYQTVNQNIYIFFSKSSSHKLYCIKNPFY